MNIICLSHTLTLYLSIYLAACLSIYGTLSLSLPDENDPAYYTLCPGENPQCLITFTTVVLYSAIRIIYYQYHFFQRTLCSNQTSV